jgi:hypothetical protein
MNVLSYGKVTTRMTTAEFDQMWERVHTVRSGTAKVSVDVEALKKLLMDHSDCLKVVREAATS